MDLIHLLLYCALGFAVLVILLFGIHFFKERCSKRDRIEGLEIQNEGDEATMIEESIRYIPSTSGGGVLISRPSAPLLTEHIVSSSPRPSLKYFDLTNIMRTIQAEQLSDENQRVTAIGDLNCNLIIGVFAQPTIFGGYCINLKEKTVEFYSLKVNNLPWRVIEYCPEFQMKNALFALLLWGEEIREARKIRIYTANHSIYHDNNKYGRRAAKLLEHYSSCEAVTVVNENRVPVNPDSDQSSYAVYIQPAEDLCSWKLPEFRHFLSSYYDISTHRFAGSHTVQTFNSGQIEQRFKATDNYWFYIEQVRDAMAQWTEPCPKCGYVYDETGSITSINRIA